MGSKPAVDSDYQKHFVWRSNWGRKFVCKLRWIGLGLVWVVFFSVYLHFLIQISLTNLKKKKNPFLSSFSKVNPNTCKNSDGSKTFFYCCWLWKFGNLETLEFLIMHQDLKQHGFTRCNVLFLLQVSRSATRAAGGEWYPVQIWSLWEHRAVKRNYKITRTPFSEWTM